MTLFRLASCNFLNDYRGRRLVDARWRVRVLPTFRPAHSVQTDVLESLSSLYVYVFSTARAMRAIFMDVVAEGVNYPAALPPSGIRT